MTQRQLLSDHPAHRDSDDMCRRKSEMVHQRGGVVRQHRDAVIHIRLFTKSGAALVKGEHAKTGGASGCEVGKHTLIALRAMNHDQWRAASAQRISQLDAVDACPFHTRQLLRSAADSKSRAEQSRVSATPARPLDARADVLQPLA